VLTTTGIEEEEEAYPSRKFGRDDDLDWQRAREIGEGWVTHFRNGLSRCL
jgi:hypothetical protein